MSFLEEISCDIDTDEFNSMGSTPSSSVLNNEQYKCIELEELLNICVETDVDKYKNKELKKVTEKSGFIAAVTNIGGPFYTSSYEMEFCRGLSITLRSIWDLFESNKKNILIETGERFILLSEIESILVVLVGQPRNCEICTSINYVNIYEKLKIFYNFLVAILFKPILSEISNTFNAINTTNRTKFLFDYLYDSLINSQAWLFNAILIHHLHPNLRKRLEIYIHRILPLNTPLLIIMHGESVLTFFINKSIRSINFYDFQLIINIYNRVHVDNGTICFIPIVLTSINENACFQLYIDKRDHSSGMGLIFLGANSNEECINGLINTIAFINKKINSSTIFSKKLLTYLCKPFKIEYLKIKHIINFICIYHDKIIPQFFSSISELEFNNRYKTYYQELFFISKNCLSYYKQSEPYSYVYFYNSMTKFSVYALLSANLKFDIMMNVSSKLWDTVNKLFYPIRKSTYYLD